MGFEQKITAFANKIPGLSDAVGGRVHWSELPKDAGAGAYVLMHVVDAPRARHFRGACSTQRVIVQFDIWASSASDAAGLRDKLIAAVEALPGEAVPGLGCSFVEADRSTTRKAEKGAPKLFGRQVDVTFSYEEES